MASVTKARGKIMIAGEYAVLFGCPALVAPSSEEAICTFSPQTTTTLKAQMGDNAQQITLLEAVIKTCSAAGLTVPTGEYIVDTTAFFHKALHIKLGIGSSAAATVALTKMILQLNHIVDQHLLLALSLKSHQQFSGGLGSGADVAAAAYGTPIEFAITDTTPVINEIEPSSFLTNLVIVGTSRAQSTRELVSKVVALKNTAPHFLADFVMHTKENVLALKTAHTETDFIDAMHALATWLNALGEHSNLALLSPEHQAIIRLAHSYGGAAKPSGAGGGDVAIAYVPARYRADFIEQVSTITGSVILSNTLAA